MEIEKEIKQTKFDNEWLKAIVNIHYTSCRFNDQMIKVLKPHKINDQHYNILRILRGKYPNHTCPGEIKEVLINKRGDLTRLLDKLNTLDYVERSTNCNNRRRVDIKITQKGLNLLKNLQTKIDKLFNIKEKISEQEAKTLNHLLDKSRG